jgi:hypothetical protein
VKLLKEADAALELRDFAAALRSFEEVIGYRPHDAELLVRAGRLAWATGGDLHQAKEWVMTAVEIDGQNAAAHSRARTDLSRRRSRRECASRARDGAHVESARRGSAERAARNLRASARTPLAGGEVMSRVIGIDLGTTNSCVAVVDNGQPVVIPNTGGYKTTPSMFALAEDGKRLVGHLAKRQAITNARNTVYASKRLIGRRYDSAEVRRAVELCPTRSSRVRTRIRASS